MTPERDRPTDEVLRRVQGEFLEMPGLRLTGAQARRLWGLDADVCGGFGTCVIKAPRVFELTERICRSWNRWR